MTKEEALAEIVLEKKENLHVTNREIIRIKGELAALKQGRSQARIFLHATDKRIKKIEAYLRKLVRGQIELAEKAGSDGKPHVVRVK
ncbi:MAG: hypothetical protein OEZ32_13710 [Nitrospinota bacterium]|nr:hypothetical protein [Nitrospinota bacterium]